MTFVRLPTDVLEEIAGYLDFDTLHAMRGTCYSWKLGLEACSSLWNDFGWTCFPRGHSKLQSDVQMLDFWLSVTSRAELSLTICDPLEEDAQAIAAGDYSRAIWPLDPYAGVLAAHQHRIKHLVFSFKTQHFASFLKFLSPLHATQSLELQVSGANTVAAIARASHLLRGMNNSQAFPNLRSIYLKNFAFDSLVRWPDLDRIVLLQLWYDAEYLHDFHTYWLANAWASCPALKELQIVLSNAKVDDEPSPNQDPFSRVSGRELDRLFVSLPGSSRAILTRAQHLFHRAVTIAYAPIGDECYSLCADVHASVSLSLIARRPSDGSSFVYLCLNITDARDFVRSVEWIYPPSDGAWDYQNVWQYIDSSQLRTIHVNYQHWLRLADGIHLPTVETLIVQVSPRDERLAGNVTQVGLPKLQTVRFEAMDDVDWQPLGEDAVIAFLDSLAASSSVIPRVEFNRWARISATDYEAVQTLAGEIVME